MAAAAGCMRLRGRAVLRPERMSASAGGVGIRILNPKPPAHHIIDIVDRRSSKIVDGDRIDDDANIVERESKIVVARLAFKRHAILQTRASTSGNEHPQGMIRNVPFLEQPSHAGHGGLGELDRTRLNLRGLESLHNAHLLLLYLFHVCGYSLSAISTGVK